MAKYLVTLDASRMEDQLHDIEQRNANRVFTASTLYYAKALRNVALFASGAAMYDQPRKMAVGGKHEHLCGKLHVTIERNA